MVVRWDIWRIIGGGAKSYKCNFGTCRRKKMQAERYTPSITEVD